MINNNFIILRTIIFCQCISYKKNTQYCFSHYQPPDLKDNHLHILAILGNLYSPYFQGNCFRTYTWIICLVTYFLLICSQLIFEDYPHVLYIYRFLHQVLLHTHLLYDTCMVETSWVKTNPSYFSSQAYSNDSNSENNLDDSYMCLVYQN